VAEESQKKGPPTPGPYLFTLILLGVGLWFAYDGWLNPDIESKLFNRILAPVFLVAALWDGLSTRRRLARRAESAAPSDEVVS
jgi:hypothetical protein